MPEPHKFMCGMSSVGSTAAYTILFMGTYLFLQTYVLGPPRPRNKLDPAFFFNALMIINFVCSNTSSKGTYEMPQMIGILMGGVLIIFMHCAYEGMPLS